MNTRSIPEHATLCALERYTFTDDAALFLQEQYPHTEIENYGTIEEAAKQTRDGKYVIVPVENSSSGEKVFVSKHYPILADTALSVVASVQMRVHMCLVGRGDLQHISHIYSHPQALSQCSSFLCELPGIQQHETRNTAEAARLVAEKQEPAHAALSSKRAADAYGLDVLKENVANTAFNATEMYVLHKNGGKTGLDPYAHYHSIELHPENKPGSLLKGLDALAENNIDLVSLHSIPTHKERSTILIEAEKRGNPSQIGIAWKHLADQQPVAFGSWNERLLSDPNAQEMSLPTEQKISIEGLKERSTVNHLNIVPLNRRGILRDILKILSDEGVNIQHLHSYAIAPRQYGFTIDTEDGNVFKAHDRLAISEGIRTLEWK